MLIATFEGLRYHRMLAENVNENVTATLKSDYDYSFVISYGDFEDKEYLVLNKNAGLIYLSEGLDKIFSKFHQKNRQQIRKTETIESLSFNFGIKEFDIYYNFYTRCEHERGWLPVPPEELRNSVVISALFNDQYIAGITGYSEGTRLRLGRIYSTRRTNNQEEISNAISGSSTKRIIFEFCKYGIENGFETLDLGGVDLQDNIKSGITQFKQSFGIEIVPVKLGRFEKEAFTLKKDLIKAKGIDIT